MNKAPKATGQQIVFSDGKVYDIFDDGSYRRNVKAQATDDMPKARRVPAFKGQKPKREHSPVWSLKQAADRLLGRKEVEVLKID